jgi:regulatory protein
LDNKKKHLTKEEALSKLQRYCVYQDRCHKEIRSKLLDLGIYGDTLEEIISELIQENFLNEERFARSYARGKFRMRKWGKSKILQGLKYRNISEYCIRKAMEEIEALDYEETLIQLIQKKWEQSKEKDPFKKRNKIAKYLAQRGYEYSLIWPELKKFT